MSLTELKDSMLQNDWAVRLFWIGLSIVVIFIIITLLKRTANNYIKDNNSRYRSKKAINFFGYLLAVIVVLFIYTDKLGGVTMALGLAGAGIAFALQEVIVSIAGWLSIMFGGSFKSGDRVQFGGIKGDIIDIGILKSTIMEVGQWVDGELYNGRIVTVANSFVFKEPVFNYTADFPFLWDEININVKHGSDYELVRKILQETGEEITGEYVDYARKSWEKMVKKYFIEDAIIDPMVSMTANENLVQFTLRYIVDTKKRRMTKDKLFTTILNKISDSEGSIQFTTSTLQLVEPDVVSVKIN